MAGLDQGMDDRSASMMGGLEAAAEPDYEDVIARLRARGSVIKPDAVSKLSSTLNPAPPRTIEYEGELRRQIEASRTASEAAKRWMMDPPINTNLPWLRFGAGMLGPTKTGSGAESLSMGVEGLAKGMEEQEAQRLNLGRLGMQQGVTGETNAFNEYGRMSQLTEQARHNDALLKRAQQQSMLTPAIREFIAAHPGEVTIDDIANGTTPKHLVPELTKAINLARGTSDMKNAAAALDETHPDYANLVRTFKNQPEVAKFYKQAGDELPRDQFIGLPITDYWQMIDRRVAQLRSAAGNNPGAGGAGLPMPGGKPGTPGAPAIPGGAPSSIPGGRSASEQPAESVAKVGNFIDYAMANSKNWQQNPGVVQDTKSRQLLDEAALERYKSDVLPAVSSGEQLIQAANSLDQINPKSSPAASFIQAAGNVGSVLGLPPTNALVARANDLNTAEKVTHEMQNAILLKAKGIQTEGDAKRALAQIANLNDTQEVFDATRVLMRALGERMVDAGSFHTRYAEMNAGQMAGAPESWAKVSKEVPLIKRVAFKGGGSGFLTYKEFIEQHMKAGQTYEQAVAELKKK